MPADPREPASRASSFVVGAALGLAVAAGLAEAAMRRFSWTLSPRLVDAGFEFFWILPVAMVLFAAPVIAIVAALHYLWPGRVRVPGAVLAVAVVPVLGISTAFFGQTIHGAVHLILALGAATVLSRVVESHRRAVVRVATVVVPVLLATPIIAIGIVLTARARADRPGPTAPGAGAPNVLLVVWDTARRLNLSLYGYDRETTPRVAARGLQGVVFDQAYSTAPWTLPSHASLFTGRIMQDLSTGWNRPLDATDPVLAELFAEAGYRTGGFTDNLMATTRPTGLARGFQHYEDWPLGRTVRHFLSHLTLAKRTREFAALRRVRSLQPLSKGSDAVTNSFLGWLDRSAADRPFFAFLNYFDAHEPYRAPARYRQRFTGRDVIDRYDAALAFQDDEFERLLTALASRGLLDNTIVVLTADHGEAFGDHGYHGHGESLFTEQLGVPLLILAPGRVPAGRRVEAPVSTRHLAPTLLDLAGLGSAVPRVAGTSLVRYWRDSAVGADTVLAGAHRAINALGESQISTGNATAMILGSSYYIRTGAGQQLLFDVGADPLQTRDLAGAPQARPVVDSFQAFLASRLGLDWTRTTARPSPADSSKR